MEWRASKRDITVGQVEGLLCRSLPLSLPLRISANKLAQIDFICVSHSIRFVSLSFLQPNSPLSLPSEPEGEANLLHREHWLLISYYHSSSMWDCTRNDNLSLYLSSFLLKQIRLNSTAAFVSWETFLHVFSSAVGRIGLAFRIAWKRLANVECATCKNIFGPGI